MREIDTLIQKAKEHGATFIIESNTIRVRAPEPIPDDLFEALRTHRTEVKEYLIEQESKLQPGTRLLEEWRNLSIPHWRRVLLECIETGNAKREEYARWMLKEILQDPEYTEA